MSWAAQRQTRRIEDIAYCLMGLFSVNMPMLYGEGSKAFLRLQKKIWKQCEDQSLFMWSDPRMDPDTPHGLLADSPAAFANLGHSCAFEDEEGNSLLQITDKGVRIQIRIQKPERRIATRLHSTALLLKFLEKSPGRLPVFILESLIGAMSNFCGCSAMTWAVGAMI